MPRRASVPGSGTDGGEKTVRLRVEPSCKIQDILAAAANAIPKCQGPKALPGHIAVERPEERAGQRVVGIDLSTTRIGDAVQIAIGKVPGRIVSYAHRYKRPPRKKQAVSLTRPAVVTRRAAAPPPANDARKATSPPDGEKSAIVTTASRKQRIADGPPPLMELPLSRQPVEREGDDYKRLKAAMARRLRGE